MRFQRDSPPVRASEASRFTELMLSPVRQGMDAQSAARHHIENLLAGYAFAVSTGDRDLLAELTRGVQVRLGGDDSQDRKPGPDEIWAWLEGPAGPGGIIQTVNTIGVHVLGNSAHYVATFQNWEAGPEPSCTAIGTYAGSLVSGPQVWKWTVHTVGRHAVGRSSAALSRSQHSGMPRGRGLRRTS